MGLINYLKKREEKKIGEPEYNLDITLNFVPILKFATECLEKEQHLDRRTSVNLFRDISDVIKKAEKDGFYTGFTVTDKGYLIIGKDSSLETEKATIPIEGMEEIWALMEKEVDVDAYGHTIKSFPRLHVHTERGMFYIKRDGKYLHLDNSIIIDEKLEEKMMKNLKKYKVEELIQ